MKHVVVAHDKGIWCAVPANNGCNGPVWQWGDEILIGYTQGTADFTKPGHQVDYINPHESYLARSKDGGETWETWKPNDFVGNAGFLKEDAIPLHEAIDFTSPGFAMRVEGFGYHGNAGHHWFYSEDKGESWKGPYTFGNLLEHPQLAGREFTGRTAYLVNASSEMFLFLSVRDSEGIKLEVSTSDKVFLAKTTDGGMSFDFVSWVVPPSDPHRAVMPAPVRMSETELLATIRRKDREGVCWIDCYGSQDNGESWAFLSRVGETGGSNGNPPAMVKLEDGRVCCVYGNRDDSLMIARTSADGGNSWGPEQIIRDGLQSRNGHPDLGYPRLFQRTDGNMVATYFWCSPDKPETHIAATIFEP